MPQTLLLLSPRSGQITNKVSHFTSTLHVRSCYPTTSAVSFVTIDNIVREKKQLFGEKLIKMEHKSGQSNCCWHPSYL